MALEKIPGCRNREWLVTLAVSIPSKYLEMTEQASEAARRLASLRRVNKKACPVCGIEFEGIAKRIYDRPACQVQAYRLRKKERSARRMDLD